MQCSKRLRKEWSTMDATLKFNLRAGIKATNQRTSFKRFFYCDWPLLFAGISTRTHNPIFGKQKQQKFALKFQPPSPNEAKFIGRPEWAPACNNIQRIYAYEYPDIPAPFCNLCKPWTGTHFVKYWYVCELFSSYCFYSVWKGDLFSGIDFYSSSRGMFGPGLDGNRPRCAPFWDDFFACVVKNGRNEQWALCKEYREDFMECLHHKKLVRFCCLLVSLSDLENV